MDNFIEILTRPDNLPIVGMVLVIGWLLRVWAREARRNDRLVREGRKEEIARRMRE